MTVRRFRAARRIASLAVVAATMLMACSSSDETEPGPATNSSRPNLLLVTVDTLRADRLACYGGKSAAGVDLCALFETGSRYAWAFSTAPSTAPSITSILTSRYPRDHGVTQHGSTRLADELLTVTEVLSAAGYATGAVISNPVIRRPRNLGQGFDHFDDRMTRVEANRPTLLEREASDATDAALAWVGSVSEPWFLWVHYQDPHGPYEPPDATPVRDAAADERLTVLEDHSGFHGIPAYQALPGVVTARAYEWRYAQEIRHLERHLVRLIAGLDAIARPPAILLTADHGEAFGEDGFFFAHGHSVGLDQIRVPLLWREPDGRGASAPVTTRPVSTIDVAPTLLRAAGLEIPQQFEGVALGAGGSGTRPLYAEHRLRVAVISGDRYYARDRRPISAPVEDAVSGGSLPPLPTRSARLDDDGSWSYAVVEEIANDPLEPAAEAYLSEAARQIEERVDELDPMTRDALEALGYLQ